MCGIVGQKRTRICLTDGLGILPHPQGIEWVVDRVDALVVGDKVLAQKFIERIALLIKENENARNYFKEFINGLHKNINDSIDEGQAIEMLAQHMITRPVFDALFKEYEFVNNNAVSRSMQDMLRTV